MNIVNTKSIVDGNNYVVWQEGFEHEDLKGLFVLHVNGKRKTLPMCNYLLTLGQEIYFCDNSHDFWKNHREPVGVFNNGMVIYRWMR